MAERIPQSVAKLIVFRAYLASDGSTPATGKTIAITISKNGGAFGNPNAGATNATEISSGFYKFTLDTTDCGTQGPLAWRGAEASIFDAGDVLEVVSAKNAGFSGVPDAAADAAGGLPISDAGGLDLDAVFATTQKLDDTLEDDAGTFRFTTNALEQAPTGGSAPTAADIRIEMDANSTQLAAIVADTNELQTDWANGGRLDVILDATATASNLATVAGYVDTEVGVIITHLTDIKGATWSAATDTLEAIRDRGDIAWVTATGFSTLTTGDIDARLAAYDGPTHAELTAELATADDATLVQIALVKAKTDLIPASPAAVGDAMTLANSSISSDTFDVAAEAAGAPTGFLEMLRWLAFRLGLRKVVKDADSIEVLLADDTTVGTANTYTSVGGTDEIEKAT